MIITGKSRTRKILSVRKQPVKDTRKHFIVAICVLLDVGKYADTDCGEGDFRSY